MVARMSPLFEWSETALSFVKLIGAITALFMAFLGIVQNDIKRVIAYSTLSQLGYMTVALGVSAYSAAIFHLMTHAFFKALLFLAAGSVIIALHHEQDLRRMGGLRKYMPITYVTAVIGSLALAGIPPFAGFFSKDSIIEAVSLSHVTGHAFAYVAVLGGVFVTAFYSFRMLFLAFHGDERFRHHAADEQAAHQAQDAHAQSSASGDEPDPHAHEGGPPRESPWVITVPLILLAIPSVYAGWAYIQPMLFGKWFGDSIVVREPHAVVGELAHEWHGALPFILHGVASATFWLAVAGIVAAVYLYLVNPAMPARIVARFHAIYTLLDNKYFFDRFNDWFFAGGSRWLGRFASNYGDRTIIDGWVVNGSAALVGFVSREFRRIQSGYVYHYAFVMIVGVFGLLYWWGVR
jgi:NADH-quinone oxidoreductase subunit L